MNTRTLLDPSFHDTVDIIRTGQLSAELDTQLAEMIQAVQTTGKPGELTLKIKVKKSKSDQIELSDAVIPKMPQPERKATYVFALENGAVSQADPRQRRFWVFRNHPRKTPSRNYRRNPPLIEIRP